MLLLGGRRPDPNTIRLPFTLEGMLTGMLYVAPNGYDRGLTDPARLVGVPLLVAMLATSGLLLGAFGSGITLRRFPRT
jgi:cell division protein FtsX